MHFCGPTGIVSLEVIIIKKYVIDRFEGDYAVLEDPITNEPEDFLKADMPTGARPGQTVVMQNGKWVIDYDDTNKRHDRIKSMFDRIKKTNGYQ